MEKIEKRAYYKQSDQEGAVFIKGITKEQFTLLCELLGAPVNSIKGLEALPTIADAATETGIHKETPELPAEYADAVEVSEMEGFDPEELQDNFAKMFDGQKETSDKSETDPTPKAEAVAKETDEISPAPTSVSETPEEEIPVKEAPAKEAPEVKTPEVSEPAEEPAAVTEEYSKYIFSILKVGETAVSSPAKAVKEMKAYAQSQGILLYNEGPKMYVVTKNDKEKLEKVYSFVKGEK